MVIVLKQLLSLGVANIVRGQLARVSGVMLFASLGAGFLGYVYQIVISKLLSPADFGLASALMALMSILMVPLGAYTMVLTRNYAAYFAIKEKAGLFYQYKKAWKQVTVVALVVLVCFGPMWPLLVEYLKIPSDSSAVIFTILVATVVLTSPNAALFQGTQNFTWVAINGILGQAGKLTLGVLFILLGWSVDGVLAGIVATTLIVLLLNARVIHRYFHAVERDQYVLLASSENFRTVFPVLIAGIAFAALSQLDLILVKANFPSESAGAFAVAAVFGKAVMYLPGAIVVALFPMVAENEANRKGSMGLLFQGLAIAFVLSTAAGIVYYFVAEWLIEGLYGQKYNEAIEVLRYYSLAMIPMSIVMVMEYFLMAKRRVLFAYLMVLALPIEVILIELYHQSLMQVVWIMALCNWVLVVVGFTILLWQNKVLVMKLAGGVPDK